MDETKRDHGKWFKEGKRTSPCLQFGPFKGTFQLDFWNCGQMDGDDSLAN